MVGSPPHTSLWRDMAVGLHKSRNGPSNPQNAGFAAGRRAVMRCDGAMTRARPLPSSFSDGAFAVAEAHRHGISRSRLRAGDLDTPTRGVRVAKPATTSVVSTGESPSARMQRLKADLIKRAQEFAPALTPDQFYSGSTGLALLGCPIPYSSGSELPLHVAARRPAGQPRRSGTIGHRLQRREPARSTVRGVPIEHPARLWRQAARDWTVDDLIAAGDFLVLPRRGLLTIDDLRAEVTMTGDVHGALAQALAEIRFGAESPEETRLRLALVRAGLPEPELNWSLRAQDGGFIARLDLAYPRYRVASEYDGRGHAYDDAQFARDADRWDEIRDAGWRLVRILSHHLRPDPGIAVDKVSDQLLAAGWRPGHP